MAYDVYPLNGRDHGIGLGRVGTLPAPMDLADFSKNLKAVFNLSMVKVTGPANMPVKMVALCSGSGSGLLKSAVASGADVYVSGDLGYHTARDAQQAGIGLVDIGHFGSEYIVVDALATALRKVVDSTGISVDVAASDMERDPFQYL
jgi:putative NIF3 family GTP cyclohydrolase 1 type 2